MRRKSWLAVLAAGLLLGFGVLAGFLLPPGIPDWASADELILYSVDGTGRQWSGPPPAETLHHYPVLGKVTVSDVATRRRLARAFADGVWLAEQDVEAIKCHWPRHAVRVTGRDGVTTIYLLCFECQNYARLVGGVRDRHTHLIRRSARPAFDAPLTAAGVPIAPE